MSVLQAAPWPTYPQRRPPPSQGRNRSFITPPSVSSSWDPGSLGTRPPPAPLNTQRSRSLNDNPASRNILQPLAGGPRASQGREASGMMPERTVFHVHGLPTSVCKSCWWGDGQNWAHVSDPSPNMRLSLNTSPSFSVSYSVKWTSQT